MIAERFQRLDPGPGAGLARKTAASRRLLAQTVRAVAAAFSVRRVVERQGSAPSGKREHKEKVSLSAAGLRAGNTTDSVSYQLSPPDAKETS